MLPSLARVWVVSVWSSPSLALAVLVYDTYSLMLFPTFHFSHYFIDVIVSFVDYTLFFLIGCYVFMYFFSFTWI